jgi:hypothetical protein
MVVVVVVVSVPRQITLEPVRSVPLLAAQAVEGGALTINLTLTAPLTSMVPHEVVMAPRILAVVEVLDPLVTLTVI